MAPTRCGLRGEEAQLTCSKCKSVMHCSREHQRESWQQHKKVCKRRFSLADLDNPNNQEAARVRNPVTPAERSAMITFPARAQTRLC